MKKNYLFLLVAISVVMLMFAAGCAGQEELKAEFTANIANAVCFYKEEFDLEPYIEKQSGVNYTIYAEQIDGETLDTVELSADGFKFTPILNEEVLVRFTAERNGEKVNSKEIKIFLEIKVDPLTETIIASWKDESFLKDINLDPQYIKSGNNTSIMIKWFGKEISDKDRFQYFITLMGNEVTSYYSVTDWTDAVLSFWVYNPTDYEIEFAPIWSHDGANLLLQSDSRTIQIAKANAWTEIKYSLRYYGMTENFYYDEDLYYSIPNLKEHYGKGTSNDGWKNINQNWWTCRWGGRKQAGSIYEYKFYVDGFDIRNYDAAKDADIDHELNGFNNVPIEAGQSVTIDIDGNDGNTFSFEYKITSEEGTFGVALIEDDWDKGYFGYFTFDKNGAVDEYAGVTVTDLEDGFKKVSFDLKSVELVYNSATGPNVIKTFFIRADNNQANEIIRNVG